MFAAEHCAETAEIHSYKENNSKYAKKYLLQELYKAWARVDQFYPFW